MRSRSAAAAFADPASPPASTPGRLRSLDLVRGAVMILMAVDHVRVYAGVPAGGPSPDVFFTRWITHFCAPAFVFLAGTGAFLHGRKLGDRGALTRFLLVRGAWLVLLELTVVRFAWTFNFDIANYNLAGVIWVIGWSMIVLAALLRLPVAAIGAIGIVLVAGHDAVGPSLFARWDALQQRAWFPLLQFLYMGGEVKLGAAPPLAVLYVLVPWVGVMAAGYAFGAVMTLEARRRARVCAWVGVGMIAAFVLLRSFNLYGEPRPWDATAQGAGRLLGFLNTSKYPASLQFLLMTLGPAIALLPLLERARGRLANAVELFGRVPLFYYLLHIPAIHLAAIAVSLIRVGHVEPWLFANHPLRPPPPPDGYPWRLSSLYLVTVIVVVALYFPCRWFARVRAARRHLWLSYL